MSCRLTCTSLLQLDQEQFVTQLFYAQTLTWTCSSVKTSRLVDMLDFKIGQVQPAHEGYVAGSVMVLHMKGV